MAVGAGGRLRCMPATWCFGACGIGPRQCVTGARGPRATAPSGQGGARSARFPCRAAPAQARALGPGAVAVEAGIAFEPAHDDVDNVESHVVVPQVDHDDAGVPGCAEPREHLAEVAAEGARGGARPQFHRGI